MGRAELFYYHLYFENLLLKSYGNMFQEHFYNVMNFYNPNFTKIEIQGAVGDRGCDGYLRTEGIFYQVYGPKETVTTDSNIQKYVINKAEGDFIKLRDNINNGYWEPIKQYTFVLNNYRGIFPDLSEKLKELNVKYSPIKFDIMDRISLINIFDSLNETQKISICNCLAPEINIGIINNTIIGEIISYLTNNVRPKENNNKLIAPDFNKKLKWNNLSAYNSNALTMANYSVNKLDTYLKTYRGNNISEELCSIYSDLYKDAKQQFPNDSNAQFNYILNNSYKNDNLSPANDFLYTTNTYIIMSKFFESCDIFEEPQENKEQV
ncbi:ABC-three component system protein [Clostridium sp. BJN0001]|uniref:ABC-three component system protein n=1 Tax=Clostridium sp. BJN0001 TaxID=2930219 RepID=UPI001FD179A7|nr:ABC-three component system protein [Clostridium sp. BJN0001]